MAVVEQSVSGKQASIATPIKVILVGAILALIEGAYDIINANLYAGIIDGVTVTATDIAIITGVAMVVALVLLAYAYAVRHEPTRTQYVLLGVLGLVTLVVGVLFTASIVLLGALIGVWETS
ncbi:hypothetical protein [Natronomonas sp.]|uniref:hypothetical protein n=1 Tax=Natronomonas sp. TaxID=2184060 RepID=UPI002FC34CC2